MSYVYVILAICSVFVLIGIADSLKKIGHAWSYWMQQMIVRDELDGLNEAIAEAEENLEDYKKKAASA